MLREEGHEVGETLVKTSVREWKRRRREVFVWSQGGPPPTVANQAMPEPLARAATPPCADRLRNARFPEHKTLDEFDVAAADFALVVRRGVRGKNAEVADPMGARRRHEGDALVQQHR